MQTECATAEWHRLSVHTGQLLHLHVWAGASEIAEVNRWLTAPAKTTTNMTWRHLLRNSARAIDKGLLAISTPTQRPQAIEMKLIFLPEGCNRHEAVDHGSSPAARRITFPLLTSVTELRTRPRTVFTVRKVIRTTAHEAAHILQIFPFTADRMKWFNQGGLRLGRNGQENLSTAVERDALLIEHAVAQAILPQPTGDTFHGVLWQQAPELFKVAIGHPADVEFQSAFQAELHALFGSNMHDIRDEPRLRRLLARAAQLLDRAPSAGAPSLTHQRRGDRAMTAIRKATPPIYFKDEPYGAIGLPDQIRSQLLEIQGAMTASGPAPDPIAPAVIPQAASSSGR